MARKQLSSQEKNDRRTWLKATLATPAALSALHLGAQGGSPSESEVCSANPLTPSQPEGPFYPEQNIANWEPDTDLTTVSGSTSVAIGTKLTMQITVTDDACQPLQNAQVEMWQADYQGVYNHSRDPRINELTPDPNFQFWARTNTNTEGKATMLTIKPGAYPASSDWIRPPHFHMRITAPGQLPLTTQIYLAPHASDTFDVEVLDILPGLKDYYLQNGGAAVTDVLHRFDAIMQNVPEEQQKSVILSLIEENPAAGKPLRYPLTIKMRGV